MASTLVKSVRIDPQLWAYVEERAAKRKISANAWVVRMIEQVRAGQVQESKS